MLLRERRKTDVVGCDDDKDRTEEDRVAERGARSSLTRCEV